MTFIQVDRDSGWAYRDKLWLVTQSCFDSWGYGMVEATDCVNCGTAVVRYVYGVN